MPENMLGAGHIYGPNREPRIVDEGTPGRNEFFQMARSKAPILCLHPDEPAMPMDPIDFIRKSRFRWHYSRKRDKGYNKTTEKWKRTNSKSQHYYDIPLHIINSYAQRVEKGKKKHRAPRKKGRASYQQVFLDPRRKDLAGSPDPNGRIPAFYYIYHSQGKAIIEYWYLFGNNPTPPLKHEGDWVKTQISVNAGGGIDHVWFPRHGVKPVERLAYGDARLSWHRGRPLVYVSWASHGTWPQPGRWPFEQLAKNSHDKIAKLLAKRGIADVTSGDGYRWDISQKLLPLAEQPWKDFAGGWGGVGLLAETSGPLGPWYRKRKTTG